MSPAVTLTDAVRSPGDPAIAPELLAVLPAHTYLSRVGPLWGATWTSAAGVWSIHHQSGCRPGSTHTQVTGPGMNVLLHDVTADKVIGLLRLFNSIEAGNEARAAEDPDPGFLPKTGLAIGGVIPKPGFASGGPILVSSDGTDDNVAKIINDAAARHRGGSDLRS